MEAIILCAGSGRRLYPLTKNKPKCLLKIGEKTILEYSIENLKEAGVERIFVVSGYNKKLIEDLIEKNRYKDIQFIENSDFASTNTAFSLNLALKKIDSDFILLNGDVLFDKNILPELINHPEKNCVVVDSTKNLNEEEVKVTAFNMKVKKINKELDPKICLGEAIGANKISRDSIPKLSRIFTALEKNRENNHFFEKGIEKMCENNGHFGILLTDKPWVEIDTMEDYNTAINVIHPKLFS